MIICSIPSVCTYTQGRPLSGRILFAVAAMNAMSLHQLIGRWVCPEMVSCLHFCVLQSTGSHCDNEGEQLKDADACCKNLLTNDRKWIILMSTFCTKRNIVFLNSFRNLKIIHKSQAKSKN